MSERIADQIVEELEQKILTGNTPEDGRLDEAKLAEQFGVSRTPIREALQRLAHSGLVEHIPRRGVFVKRLGPAELYEMFEVMSELEAICGKLAAIRISEEALCQLAEANKKCLEALQRNDSNGYYKANEVFHHIIYQESGNDFLAQQCINLHRRLRPFRRLQLKVRGRMEQSMHEHEAVVAHLIASDPVAAADELRSHVAVQGEKFHLLISSYK